MRLRCKLEDDPEICSKYCEKIEAAIAEGHIIRISDTSLQKENDSPKPRYYIPHFNTTQAKFRVVYDAAREHKGVSLNGLLERGPIFMQSLKSILIFMQSLKSILICFGEKNTWHRRRYSQYVFQIRIGPEDQHIIRILWFDGPGIQGNVAVYRFQVAPYGLRCIPSIAGYSMIYTAEKNIPNVPLDVSNRVTRDMFVDDFISGVDSIEEGKRVIRDMSKLLSSTGFKLTKWNASSAEILSNVTAEDNILQRYHREASRVTNWRITNYSRTDLGY